MGSGQASGREVAGGPRPLSRRTFQAGPRRGSWSLCRLGAGRPASFQREPLETPGRVERLCGTAGVLCWALGQVCPQPTPVPRPGLLVGWPPGLAPWRPQHLTQGALLGARGGPWLEPASHGSAPAASRHAHAALAPLLAVQLALRPLVPEAGPTGLG